MAVILFMQHDTTREDWTLATETVSIWVHTLVVYSFDLVKCHEETIKEHSDTMVMARAREVCDPRHRRIEGCEQASEQETCLELRKPRPVVHFSVEAAAPLQYPVS